MTLTSAATRAALRDAVGDADVACPWAVKSFSCRPLVFIRKDPYKAERPAGKRLHGPRLMSPPASPTLTKSIVLFAKLGMRAAESFRRHFIYFNSVYPYKIY